MRYLLLILSIAFQITSSKAATNLSERSDKRDNADQQELYNYKKVQIEYLGLLYSDIPYANVYLEKVGSTLINTSGAHALYLIDKAGFEFLTLRSKKASTLIDSALVLAQGEADIIAAQINLSAGMQLTEIQMYDEAELRYAAAIHSGRSAGDTDILIAAHLQRALAQAYDWKIERAFANIDIADSLLSRQEHAHQSLLSRHIRNYTIYRDNRLDEALTLTVELAAQSKQADDISVFKKSKDLESHIYYHKGDYPPAIEGYKILLAQAEEEGNLYDQVKWLNSLSYAYRMLGIFEEAVNYANNCIKVSEKYGYEIGKADAYVRLSQTFFDNKQHDKTLDAIDNAFNIYTALNDENGVALCNNSYANAYEIKQEYQKALEYYERSLAFRRTQSSAYHVVPLYNIGNVLILQERPHEAKHYLEESLSICNAQGIIGMKIRNLLGLSEAASLLDDHKKAIDLVLEAEELVNKTLYKRMIRDTYQTKSKVFAESGRFEEAYVAHQHFKTLEDSLFNESRNKQFANQAIKYETQKKDQENILLKKGLDLERSKTRAQNQLVFFVGALLVLALVFGIVQANNNRKLNKRRALIENQKKSIETRNERIETLLKEVHHRVKNNLQLIISLLDTDRSWHKDADPSSLLADSRSRVATMSLLHQSLYKHDDLVSLNIKDYIEELVSQIIEINDTRPPDHMLLDIPSVDLDIDTAIPLGLIVNELVTNVFKYGEKDGLLSLAIKMTKSAEGNYRLTVQDKGQDLPMPLSEILKESYGLKLTSGLSRQLHGQLTHQYENGNIFMVTVKDTLRRKEAA